VADVGDCRRRLAVGVLVELDAAVGARRGEQLAVAADGERAELGASLALVREHRVPRIRPHCRFRNRGTEFVRDSGVKGMSGSAKRQCDRALRVPAGGQVEAHELAGRRDGEQRRRALRVGAGLFVDEGGLSFVPVVCFFLPIGILH
jgi:hypothetical protein